MDTKTILLDVGGTFIKCSDGRSIPINSNGTKKEIATSLQEAVGNADFAAVAIPGPFDYEKGIFLMKHKFASVYGDSFAVLSGRTTAQFHFVHDVNAMLLGEIHAGAGRDYKNVALVTLGTGLGFSFSLDKVIQMNSNREPLESIYNLPFRGRMLEDFASKRGVIRAYGSAEELTVKEIADRAYSGDAKAQSAFTDMGTIISQTISPLLEKYSIECLLFGGQIARSLSLMQDALAEGLKQNKTLRHIGQVSSIDLATFNGLQTLL